MRIARHPVSKLAPLALAAAGALAPPAGAAPVVFPRTLAAQVFDHVLALSLPRGFEALPVYEATLPGPRYVREHVLEGESDSAWTQRITITGFHDSSLAGSTPLERFVESIATGLRSSCPDSFSLGKLPVATLAGLDAFGVVAGCGSAAATSGRTSETALIVAMRGARDVYTLRWTERGAPSAQPLPIGESLWAARWQALMPVRVCPAVPGEAPPYPSCTGR